MKINREELSSTIYLSLHTILVNLSTLNMSLDFGHLDVDLCEALLYEIENFQNTINFANDNLEYITDEYRDIVVDDLDTLEKLIASSINCLTNHTNAKRK